MFANESKTFLQFGGRWILKPEHVEWLELFTQAGRLDGRQSVVRIMQKVDLRPELFA